MWGDDKFCALSRAKPNGQTLWFYLISGPHTTALPCAFVCGEAALSEAMDWPLSGFRKVFGELLGKGMVQADWKARMVFIPNALKHNPPESPNVVIGWRAAFNELPDCPLKVIVFAALKAFLDEWSADKEKGPKFVEAFGEVFAKDFGQSDSDTETDSDTEQKQSEETRAVLRLGEYGHVKLRPDDLADLRTRLNGSFDELVAELDLYGETHPSKFASYRNHAAVLKSWFGRKGKGVNGNGHQTKTDRNAEASRRLLSRINQQNSGGGERGDLGGDPSRLFGEPAEVDG